MATSAKKKKDSHPEEVRKMYGRRDLLKGIALAGLGAGVVGLLSGMKISEAAVDTTKPAIVSQFSQIGDASVVVFQDKNGNSYVVDKGVGPQLGELIVKANVITPYGANLGAGTAGAQTQTAGIQEAMNSLTPNRTWEETIIIKGNFVISQPIVPASYCKLIIFGSITLANNVNNDMILASSTQSLVNFSIEGGVFNGNATNQTNGFALINLGASSLQQVKIRKVRVINAYAHGIYLAEKQTYTQYLKEVSECFVYNVGVKTVGYCIYGDYCDGLDIHHNYVQPIQLVDAIELGHVTNIGMKCHHNIVVGGPINFPFSQYADIHHNTIYINGAAVPGIANDGNSCDNVEITDNFIFGANPVASYAGIRVAGNNAKVIGNWISLASGSTQYGIRTIGSNPIITDNFVISLNATQAGGGIFPDLGYNAVIKGNILTNVSTGINVIYDNVTVKDNQIINCGTGIVLFPKGTSGHTIKYALVEGNQFSNVVTPINLTDQTDPTNRIINNPGYNPQGFAITTPAMPTSGTAQSNTFPFPVIVYLYGGTVTQITINGQVVFSSGTGISLTGQSFTLNPGDTIAITYSSAPTWKWYGL